MIGEFFSSFILGLLTPLTAVCVLPLYPGFIAYLSNKLVGEELEEGSKLPLLIGCVVVLGVIVFMLLLGLVFTTILQVSLTKVINIVSPIAFGILGIISIFLLFNVDFGRFLPRVNAPVLKNPFLRAFVFGFPFGAIVIPCNPGFIAAFFARSLLVDSVVSNLVNFLMFGLGIGFPLLVLALISGAKSQALIKWFTDRKTLINRLAGIIMLGISMYYLIIVFRVFG
jgi:cytochrome c-type biogenesis protein